MKKYLFLFVTNILVWFNATGQHFQPISTQPSEYQMNFYITGATLNGTDLQPGDEIGVFDGANCVGVGVLNQVLTGGAYLSIIAQKNEADNPGYIAGHTISYRLWDASGSEEIGSVSVQLLAGYNVFTDGEYASVKLAGTKNNSPPYFTSTPITSAQQGVFYSYTATADDDDEDPLIWSAITKPDWLTFNTSTHILSGTPTAPDIGNHSIILRINDGSESVDQTFTINVSACTPPSSPVIGTVTQPTCAVSTGSVQLNGLPSSGSWTINPGAIDGSGTSTILSGLNPGLYAWTVTNSAGCTSALSQSVTINAQPQPPAQPGSISGSTAVCQSSSQTYSVAAVSGATSYTWTLPSGWTGNSTTNSITVTTGITGGDISVTASNTCGTSTARTLAVTITTVPAQPGTITGDAAVCQGASEAYSIDAVSGAASYIWTLPSGWSGNSTSTSITATVGATGGNITVAATNACGSGTARTLAVIVSTLPAQPGTISGSTAPCQGSSQTYSVTSVTGATSYTWTMPSGWTGTSTTNSITVTVGATSGNISVTANNNCGSGTARTLAITVSNAPAQPGSISGNTSVCQGTSQTYSVTAVSGATSYAWTLPTGWTGTSTTNSITVTTGTTGGDISVTASNTCGTSTARTLAVTIITVPAQPGTITGDAVVCQGASETYSIGAVSGAASYTWTLPTGWTGTSTTTSITTTPSATGGNLSVTANNSCGSSTPRTLAVTVNTVPAQPATLSGNASVCQGTTMTYIASEVSGALSYSWTIPSGWTGSSTSNAIDVTIGNTSGNISVAGVNACGTGTSRSLTVTVSVTPAQPGSISGSTTVCQGSSQTYSVAAVSGATSYTWTLPSGWTGNSTTNSITVAAGTSGGDISVTASNNCGTSAARTLAVATTTVPAQPGTITGDAAVCQGSPETYSIGAVSGAASYTWTLPSGWTGTSTTTSINTTVGATSGNITVAATNACGSGTARTLAVTVTALPAQPGAITGSTTPCQGASQTYSVTAVTGAISYTWTMPSGWTGTSTTNSITATVGTSGYISVSANNNCGAGTARTLAVTVSTKPEQPEPISGSASACQGSSQTYSIPGVSGATTYTWTLPAGWTGSSTTNTITVTVGTTGGEISVTAGNTCGTSTARTLAVTTTTVPAQPGTISGMNTPCQGTSQTYSVAAVSGATSYTWTLPAGWTGTSTTNSITVTTGVNSGSVSVVANNSCGSGTARNLAITVSPLPTQPGPITGNTSVCPGTAQTYSITAVPGATSYTWTLPTGWTGTSTTNSITTNAGVSGSIFVVAKNSCGSGPSRTLDVIVSSAPPQPGIITGSTTVCQGTTTSYSVTAVTGATSYSWTIPAGWTGSSTTNSISVTVGTSGGDLTVVANNACGASAPRTLAVLTTSLPGQPGNITGNVSPCLGSSQTYSIGTVSGATSYTWNAPEGWTGSSTTSSITLTVGNTNGDISVTANNACGSGTAKTLTVTVSTPPAQPGTITGNTSVCQGSSQTYSIAAVTGATSYTWSLPAGWTGSSTTNSITATAGSGGTISVAANNGCGSGTARTLALSVSPIPDQPGTISGNTTVCQGSSQSYSVSPVSGATFYTWTVPAGWTGSSTSNSITVTAGTNGGSISVIANNACGNSNARSMNITVSSIPTAPVIGTVTQPTCAVSTGSVALSGLPATGTWTVTANPGDISKTGSGTTYTFSGLNPGTYNFTVANAASCESVASGDVVFNSVLSAPSAPVTGTITQPSCGTLTGSVELSGLPSSGTWTLTRNPGSVTSSGTGTTTTVSNLNPGTYTFTVSNASGCSSPSTGNVVVNSVTSTPAAPVIGTITQPTCAVSVGSVILNDLPAGAWTLKKNPEGTTIDGTGTSYTIESLNPGTYTFSVTTGNSCSSSISTDVVINNAPDMPENPVIESVIQPSCLLGTGSVVINNLPATGEWTLTMDPGAVEIDGNGSTASIAGLAPGNYSFMLTGPSGCSTTEPVNVLINEQPEIPTTPVITQVNELLHSDATEGNQWYDQNGIINNANDQEYTPTVSGDYYTIVTVNSCSSSPSNTIHVIITGIDQSDLDESLNMYPNPVRNELIVELKNHKKQVSFKLVNSNGEIVTNGIIHERKIIETSSLPSGIYLLKLESDNDYVIRKIIKD